MFDIIADVNFVHKNSQFVKINQQKISEFVKDFSPVKTSNWLANSDFEFLSLDDEQKLNFLFTFNAVSFSYWGTPKWTIEHQNKKYDGSWAMVSCLLCYFKINQDLSNMKKQDFENLLRGNTQIPLFEERWKIIQELQEFLKENIFSEFVKNAQGDALKLLELIIDRFPSFSDFSQYRGKKIHFYKRAQLLVSDIYHMFDGKGIGNLRNIDKLTACADYKLPQILRKLGILEFTPKLAKDIDEGKEIQHNSEEEIEIRANTIIAVELIKKELRKRFSKITSTEINNQLWLITQKKLPDDKPYHLTRTTRY